MLRKSFVGLGALAAVLAILLGGGCIAGCNPSAKEMTIAGEQLIKQANEGQTIPGVDLSGVPKDLLQMMKDQGVLDTFLANARIHGQNPGLAITRRQTQALIIGLDGVVLDAEAEIEGTGTQLPTATREALIDALRGLEGKTDAESNKQRDRILEILGWNRVTSDHNPPP